MSKRAATGQPRGASKAKKPMLKKQKTNLRFQPNTVKAGPEKKEHIGALPANAGVVANVTFSAATLLNALQQGATAQTRIGRKVANKSLYVRYSMALQATSTGGSPIRILIVYDKQTNGVAPAITDVLFANDFNSPNNLNNSDRFITLIDEITDVISVQNNYSIAKTIFRKIGLETLYKDTTVGDVTDIISGGIFAFLAQDSAIAVAVPQCLSLTRLRFVDN